MDTSDALVYENAAPLQTSINGSKALDNWSANASLALLFGKEMTLFANRSNVEFSSLFVNETDFIINTLANNETNASIPWVGPTAVIEVTTELNATSDQSRRPWWLSWDSTPYPSGYTQMAIVLLAFFITCIMILIVVGNMLVCIAIATEKSLKPVQNWFIASLAVSDFLLGLVIMPFSLARELMGYWMFGQVWCGEYRVDSYDLLDWNRL